MTYRTHNVFGAALLLTVLVVHPPQQVNLVTMILALIFNAIGSIAPDLDQASNRLWTLIPGGNWLGKWLNNLFGGHRAISHSILGTYLFYWLTLWLMTRLLNSMYVNIEVVVLSMMVGYVSHIAIDGITEEGVPLLWPLPWKVGFPPIRSWRIKTGKWFEKLIVFPGILIYIGVMIFNNWQILLPVK